MKNKYTQSISKNFTWGTIVSVKAGFILLLILLIQIPLFIINNTILERQNRYKQVVSEISQSWSEAQELMGPVLLIPYTIPVTDKDNNTQILVKNIICPPESLKIKGIIKPEVRYRGIFQAVVYKSSFDIIGTFKIPSKEEINYLHLTQNSHILWNSAQVSMGIKDMRRLKADINLNWNNQIINFFPGSNLPDLMLSGIHTPYLNLNDYHEGSKIPFSLILHVDGSDSINFLPFGTDTHVFAQSSWPHPSFIGKFLPDQRQVGDKGFEATWEISKFGRASYPQYFTSEQINDSFKSTVKSSMFGVRFVQPVNAYRHSERAIKYGTLFIIFTFMTYFLLELITRVRIHIFQYGLVGINLCIFFLLLIALSEHIGFTKSYCIGATLIILQISLYSLKVVKTMKRTFVITSVLTSLYIYLYIILRLEDYALFIGAIALFLALTAIMFAVRNIDWYSETPTQFEKEK